MRRQTSSFQFLWIFSWIGFVAVGGGFSLFGSQIRNFIDSESVSSPTERKEKKSNKISEASLSKQTTIQPKDRVNDLIVMCALIEINISYGNSPLSVFHFILFFIQLQMYYIKVGRLSAVSVYVFRFLWKMFQLSCAVIESQAAAATKKIAIRNNWRETSS